MPSQYVGWIRTDNRPGTEGNTGFGEDKMGQYINEMFDLGVAPAAMKGVGRTVKGVGKGFKHPSEALVGKGIRAIKNKTISLGEPIIPSQTFDFSHTLSYTKPKRTSPTLSWGKAKTIVQDSYTGSPYENILGTAEGFNWKNW